MRARAIHPDEAPSRACIEHDGFIESLSSFSRAHRAHRWEGTFGQFLVDIVPGHPAPMARTSHEYIWDMLCWHGRNAARRDTNATLAGPPGARDGRSEDPAGELFRRELFGIDGPPARVAAGRPPTPPSSATARP